MVRFAALLALTSSCIGLAGCAMEWSRPGTTEQELLVKVARRFPDLTSAELSEALQDATAAAERRVRAKH